MCLLFYRSEPIFDIFLYTAVQNNVAPESILVPPYIVPLLNIKIMEIRIRKKMENQAVNPQQVTDLNWIPMVIELVELMQTATLHAPDTAVDILDFAGDYMTPVPTDSVTVSVKVADEGGDTYVILPNKTVDYSQHISLQLPKIQEGDVGQLMNAIFFLFDIWCDACKEPTVLYEIIPQCLSGIAKNFWEMIKLRQWLRRIPLPNDDPSWGMTDDDKYKDRRLLPHYSGVSAMRELIAMLLTKQQRVEFKSMMTDLRRPVGMSMEHFMERTERLIHFLHLMEPEAQELIPDNSLSAYMEYITWKNLDEEWKAKYVTFIQMGLPLLFDWTIESVTDSIESKNHSIHFNNYQHLKTPNGRLYQFVKRELTTEQYSETVSTTLAESLAINYVLNIEYINHQCETPLIQDQQFRIETTDGTIIRQIEPVPPITGKCYECIHINSMNYMRHYTQIQWRSAGEEWLEESWKNTMVRHGRASEVYRRWKTRYEKNKLKPVHIDFHYAWSQFNELMVTEKKQADFDDMLGNLTIPHDVNFPDFFERCKELWSYRMDKPHIKYDSEGKKICTCKFVAMLWRNICEDWKTSYVQQRKPNIGLLEITSSIELPHTADWGWLGKGEHGMVFHFIEMEVLYAMFGDTGGHKRKIE